MKNLYKIIIFEYNCFLFSNFLPMKITNELLFNRKEWMLNKDFSINTIQNYETDVKTFINYIRLEKLGYTVDTNEITLMWIEKWKTYLRELPTPKNSIYYTIRPTISQSTIQSKLTAVKSLLKYINLFYDTGITRTCWFENYTMILPCITVWIKRQSK